MQFFYYYKKHFLEKTTKIKQRETKMGKLKCGEITLNENSDPNL